MASKSALDGTISKVQIVDPKKDKLTKYEKKMVKMLKDQGSTDIKITRF